MSISHVKENHDALHQSYTTKPSGDPASLVRAVGLLGPFVDQAERAAVQSNLEDVVQSFLEYEMSVAQAPRLADVKRELRTLAKALNAALSSLTKLSGYAR
jgi:hypothetical protein